jgi:hypothetical protein
MTPPGTPSWRVVWAVLRGVFAAALAPLVLVAGLVAYRQVALLRGPDPGREARRVERLREILTAAERTVPAYPGATRLAELWGENLPGTGPALHDCWRAPAPLGQVLVFYRRALPAPAGGAWRLRGATAAGDALGAERGQVRLLVHDPAAGAVAGLVCPAGTTYAASFAAYNRPSWEDPPPGPRGGPEEP